MTHEYEPTSLGNPKNFTIDQHVFPRTAIARFADAHGRLDTQSLRARGSKMRSPTAKLFCAQRVWDHAAETHRTIGYEEPYRKLADAIVSGKVQTLSSEQDDVATLFIALWNARHKARHKPMGDITMNGIAKPERDLTKEEEENLEAKGVVFPRGLTIPSRFTTGINLFMNIDAEHEQFKNRHWGIIRSRQAEFLVPDNVVGIRWIPVAPHIGLMQESDDATIDDENVRGINRIALRFVHQYYFGRNLANCLK